VTFVFFSVAVSVNVLPEDHRRSLSSFFAISGSSFLILHALMNPSSFLPLRAQNSLLPFGVGFQQDLNTSLTLSPPSRSPVAASFQQIVRHCSFFIVAPVPTPRTCPGKGLHVLCAGTLRNLLGPPWYLPPLSQNLFFIYGRGEGLLVLLPPRFKNHLPLSLSHHNS